jgi:ABC-type uncharacterized transport system permease subunit
MIDKIIARVLNMLKAKNPTLFMLCVAILGGLYYVLTSLETSIGLPGWLSMAIPYLKTLVVITGVGLNSSTAPFVK